MYNINILPDRYRKKKKVKLNLANPTYGLAILGTVAASCIFLGVQLEIKDNSIKKEIATLDSELAEIESISARVSSNISQINSYKSQIQQMQTSDFSQETPTAVTDDFYWDYMLDEVAATTIPEATITSIYQSTSNPNLVDVKVETYTLSNMARMKQSFEDSKYFREVSTSNIQQNNSTLIGRPNEVSFTLTFRYVKDPNKTPETNEGQNYDPAYGGMGAGTDSSNSQYSIDGSNFNQDNGLSEVNVNGNTGAYTAPNTVPNTDSNAVSGSGNN